MTHASSHSRSAPATSAPDAVGRALLRSRAGRAQAVAVGQRGDQGAQLVVGHRASLRGRLRPALPATRRLTLPATPDTTARRTQTLTDMDRSTFGCGCSLAARAAARGVAKQTRCVTVRRAFGSRRAAPGRRRRSRRRSSSWLRRARRHPRRLRRGACVRARRTPCRALPRPGLRRRSRRSSAAAPSRRAARWSSPRTAATAARPCRPSDAWGRTTSSRQSLSSSRNASSAASVSPVSSSASPKLPRKTIQVNGSSSPCTNRKRAGDVLLGVALAAEHQRRVRGRAGEEARELVHVAGLVQQ